MFGGKFFQTKLLSLLSHKVWRLLSSPVLLRKFTNYHYTKTKYVVRILYLVRVLHIPSPLSVVRSPQSVVDGLSFILPYLKHFTLRRVMLQGYNKSIFISEKTFSLILWKRVGHDTGRLWLPVGVTFPLETAWRRHATRNTPSLQDDRHLVCSRATSAFTLPSHHRYF